MSRLTPDPPPSPTPEDPDGAVSAETNGHAPVGTLLTRVAAVGEELGTCLRAILDALPEAPRRPNQLGRLLGVNRDISSKVLRAAEKRDPLEVVHVAPGPEPLRTLVRAAASHGVDEALQQRTEAAIARFDQLIRADAGTRDALDAIIAASLPSVRGKFELASKHSVFKGMSQLRGVQAEVWLSATLVHPAANDPMRHDIALLHGALALQRLRPAVTLKFTYREIETVDGEMQDVTIDDQPLGAMSLEPFLTNPPARLRAERAGKVVNYTLADDRIGPSALSDMLVVDHHSAVLDRYGDPATRSKKGTFVTPDIPVKTLVFDAFLHEDVYPGADPELAIYETAAEGIAWVNDPTRDIDRMDLGESIEFLGRGATRFTTQHVPRYTDMLRTVCREYDWDLDAFRGYRCCIQYPVHGWQVCMSFQPPVKPG